MTNLAFLQGLELGILIGAILCKYLSGIASIEEEAWKHGYDEGFEDGKRGW